MTNATQQPQKAAQGTVEAKPLPTVEKKSTAKRDAAYYRGKLQHVQSVLKNMNDEITAKQKKGEDMGILLRQRRSLRSWEARFQKILKAS